MRLGEVLLGMAEHDVSWIGEGPLMGNEMHIVTVIQQKYAVSIVTGYIKGKSAIHLAQFYGERKCNCAWQSF